MNYFIGFWLGGSLVTSVMVWRLNQDEALWWKLMWAVCDLLIWPYTLAFYDPSIPAILAFYDPSIPAITVQTANIATNGAE